MSPGPHTQLLAVPDQDFIASVADLRTIGLQTCQHPQCAGPLANFINANPTIIMLALGFLMMIGTALIAEGFGAKVPKGYVYAAMAFSALVEGLNMLERRARRKGQANK